jgi:hypothetical protein
MIDSGCNSILLPLRNADSLREVAEIFSSLDYTWSICIGRGVSSTWATLKISSVGSIPIFLCEDVVRPPIRLNIEYLRFHLCVDDARTIVATPAYLAKLTDAGKQILTAFLQNPPNDSSRRAHALLGQKIISQFLTVQFNQIFFQTTLEFVTRDMICHVYQLVNNILESNLPDGFEALEDEDHEGDGDVFFLSDSDHED